MIQAKTKWERLNAKRGFSLVEVMVSSTISLMVLFVVLGAFLWGGTQAVQCMKRGRSQQAATSSSTKITTYVRNAQEIHSIDEAHGNWVKLLFPDGSIGELTYINPTTDQRDGNLRLLKWDKFNRKVLEEKIVTSGVMAVPDPSGGGYNEERVFVGTPGGANLNVSYWISAPNAKGARSAHDGGYAVVVRFSVCLRNHPTVGAGA